MQIWFLINHICFQAFIRLCVPPLSCPCSLASRPCGPLCAAGKSTLLNSLISAECLPMNNVPETARICKIMHDAAAKEPSLLEPAAAIATTSRKGSNANTAPLTLTAKGEKAVRARLQQLNSDARSLEPASSLNSASSLGSATSASLGVSGSPGGVAGSSGGQGGGGGVVAGVGGSAASEPMLEIRTPLTALEMYSGQEFGQLTLLDTPGPNEAGEERLRYQVRGERGTWAEDEGTDTSPRLRRQSNVHISVL